MKYRSRRNFIKTASTGALAATFPFSAKEIRFSRTHPKLDLNEVRVIVTAHLDKTLDKEGPYGSYRKGIKQRPDLYSACDVAQIRTIWGEDLQQTLTKDKREEWIGHINSFADNSDGSYFDRYGHSKLHANGMTIGALGVLGGKQKYPVTLYDDFKSQSDVIPWLEKIDWSRQWSASHNFWGGIHCYSMSKNCEKTWLEVVFEWLNENLDEQTGWWKKGTPYSDRHQPLGGSVHILPVYEHKERKFPFPKQVIDSVLALQLPNKRWLDPGNNSNQAYYMSYLELDALYALKYMQTLEPKYRKDDIQTAVFEYGVNVIDYWSKGKEEVLSMHPHRILSAIGTFGLLQQHLPEMFYDEVNWTDIFSDKRFYRTDLVEVL
jgi:hypothetical protein